MGDAYQSYAFGWLHAAQQAGSSHLVLADAASIFVDAVNAATPKTRAMDRMAQLPVIFAASGDKVITLDRLAGVREPMNRLLLLPGHNLAGRTIWFAADTGATPWTGGAGYRTLGPYATTRGADIFNYPVATIRRGLNVWDFPPLPDQHLRTDIKAGGAVVPEIAEWWWTRMWAPTVGPEPGHSPGGIFRGLVQQLPSGMSLAHEFGPPGRRWSLSPPSVSKADYRIFEQLVAGVGISRSPFIFDPPEPYEVLVDKLDNTTGIISADCVVSLDAANKVVGTGSVRGVSGGTFPWIGKEIPADYRDMRRCIFGITVRIETTVGHLTPTDGIWLRLSGPTITDQATFRFGTNVVHAADQWVTLWIDPEVDIPFDVSGSTLDPAAVRYWQIFDTNHFGQAFNIDCVRLVYKDREPAIVRIAGEYRRPQTAPVPTSTGLEHTPQIVLEEVAA